MARPSLPSVHASTEHSLSDVMSQDDTASADDAAPSAVFCIGDCDLSAGLHSSPAWSRKQVCRKWSTAWASSRLLIQPKDTLTAPVGLQPKPTQDPIHTYIQRRSQSRGLPVLYCDVGMELPACTCKYTGPFGVSVGR